MNPNSEAAYDAYDDCNQEELMEDYINSDMITDSELVEFLLNDAKLFTAFVDAWASVPANASKLQEFFMSGLPDNDEDLSAER